MIISTITIVSSLFSFYNSYTTSYKFPTCHQPTLEGKKSIVWPSISKMIDSFDSFGSTHKIARLYSRIFTSINKTRRQPKQQNKVIISQSINNRHFSLFSYLQKNQLFDSQPSNWRPKTYQRWSALTSWSVSFWSDLCSSFVVLLFSEIGTMFVTFRIPVVNFIITWCGLC
jgi:hypothetical protein